MSKFKRLAEELDMIKQQYAYVEASIKTFNSEISTPDEQLDAKEELIDALQCLATYGLFYQEVTLNGLLSLQHDQDGCCNQLTYNRELQQMIEKECEVHV